MDWLVSLLSFHFASSWETSSSREGLGQIHPFLQCWYFPEVLAVTQNNFVYYININHLAFANLCPTAPDERDRWSFPRSSMAFRNTRILPRYIPLKFWTPKNFKNFLCFCVFLLHWVSGMMEVEELLRSSAPQLNDTGNIEERTRNNPSSNNSGFFWGKCAVYFHK